MHYKLKLFNLFFCLSVSASVRFVCYSFSTIAYRLLWRAFLNNRSSNIFSISDWHKTLYTFPVLQDVNCFFSRYHINPGEDLLPFARRTASILHGMDSTRSWKHSFEILHLLQVYKFASRNCCRFVRYTFML